MNILKNKTKIINLKFFIFCLIFPLSLSLVTSCDTTETKTHRIILKEKSVASTEVWLELNVEGFTLPQKIELIRNGKTIRNILATQRNTIVFDDNLKPLTNYDYVAKLSDRLFVADVSQIKTLDTTSHDFTWETFYFGDGNATSKFMDVEIINENDIWVVGKISGDGYDSNGKQYDLFNAVRWDGEKWNLERILSYGYCNQNQKYVRPINSISYANYGVIWCAYGNQIINASQNIAYCNTEITGLYTIEKLDDDGLIAVNHSEEVSYLNYFINGEWSRITKPEEGVNLDLLPIIDKNNETIILFPNSNNLTKKSKIYSVNKNKLVNFHSDLPDVFIASIWTHGTNPIYAVGKGLHENKNGKWTSIDYNSTPSLQKIRGSELNNIVAVGWENVVHYNGSTWKRYEELDGIYNSVAVKNDLVVIVGMQNNKAAIVVGKKN